MRKRLWVGILFFAFALFISSPVLAGAFYDDPPAPAAAKSDIPQPSPIVLPKQETKTSAPVKKEASPAPDKQQLPPTEAVLSGMVTRVINTATLELKSDTAGKTKTKKIVLFGIEKATGQIVGDLTIMIGMKGSRLRCTPADQETYRCQTADGMDVGKESLKQGIARALPSAPPEYLQAEGDAMKAKTGIWR